MGFTPDVDTTSHGKKSVAVNLKHPQGVEVFRKMCKVSDVLIEPFRKGKSSVIIFYVFKEIIKLSFIYN